MVRQQNVFFWCRTRLMIKLMGADSERLQSIRSELRKHWALDENAIVFMFAGKFIDKKRPMDFVRAASEAARAR